VPGTLARALRWSNAPFDRGVRRRPADRAMSTAVLDRFSTVGASAHQRGGTEKPDPRDGRVAGRARRGILPRSGGLAGPMFLGTRRIVDSICMAQANHVICFR